MKQLGTMNCANSFHPNYATQHDVYELSNGKTIAIDSSNSKLNQAPNGEFQVTTTYKSEDELERMYKCQCGTKLQRFA